MGCIWTENQRLILNGLHTQHVAILFDEADKKWGLQAYVIGVDLKTGGLSYDKHWILKRDTEEEVVDEAGYLHETLFGNRNEDVSHRIEALENVIRVSIGSLTSDLDTRKQQEQRIISLVRGLDDLTKEVTVLRRRLDEPPRRKFLGIF